MGKNTKKQDVIILLAQGFNETWVANCLEKLRTQGYKTWLVGLTPGLVIGKHGMAIKTDSYFSALSNNTPKLLAIADGQTCIHKLLSEPKVHQYIDHTIERGGRIAATSDTETILKRWGYVPSPQAEHFYIWQRATPIAEYTELLVNCLAA